jgi:hypothetical protein
MQDKNSRFEKLIIATAIFVRKIDTRLEPTIHINHTYQIVMTVAPVVLANLGHLGQPRATVAASRMWLSSPLDLT